MYSIRQVLTLESFVLLKGRLDATARAFYLAELVDGFSVEGSPNPPLYNLFLDTLRTVQDTPEDNEPILRFQLELLRVNGFMPELYRCVECRSSVEPGRHRFVVGLGGVICTECASKREGASPLSLPALKTLRHFHRNGDAETPRIRISSALYEEVRAVLDRAIRYWLDRDVRLPPLRSPGPTPENPPLQHPFPLDGGRLEPALAKAGDGGESPLTLSLSKGRADP